MAGDQLLIIDAGTSSIRASVVDRHFRRQSGAQTLEKRLGQLRRVAAYEPLLLRVDQTMPPSSARSPQNPENAPPATS